MRKTSRIFLALLWLILSALPSMAGVPSAASSTDMPNSANTAIGVPDRIDKGLDGPLDAVVPFLGNPPYRDRRGGPDDVGYEWRDNLENDGPRYEWVDIRQREGVRSFNLGDDVNTGALQLGFQFPFWGTNYSQIFLDTDGYASFTYAGTQYNLNYGLYPTAVNAGAVHHSLIGMVQADYGNCQIWFWTNNRDLAIASWAGNGSEQWQLILTPNGKAQIQYGPNIRNSMAGVNVGDGRHGWYIPAVGGWMVNGRAWAFGPRGAWVIAGGPRIVVAPEALAFGDVYVGGERTIVTTITNIGDEELVIEGAEVDNDAFILPDFGGQEVVIGSGQRIEAPVTFRPGEAGVYEATISIFCNAVNGEDGVFNVAATGRGLVAPAIVVDPQSIEDDLNTGETAEHVVDISNDGGAALNFTTDIEIIGEPGDDAGARGLRSVRNGPRRDPVDLEGMMFACFQTTSVWGWLDDGMRQRSNNRLTNQNFISYRTAADWNRVEFEDYDAIVVAGRDNMWSQEYANNFARFEEYVDGGGAAYYETADPNSRVRSPGDIVNNLAQSASNGVLAVSPNPQDQDYSLFAAICREAQPNFWLRGEVIEGSAWLHSGYQLQQFVDKLNNGTLEWYQVIAYQQNTQNPGAVAYGFGRGAVLTVGHPVGHCWFNYWQQGMWGSISA
ncbi:MAG: choice-of-anchor D domain-containing protein, partial [Calditrichaeota bacterium]|nr:choice-of-anchor D domain-containing protein [Calditrichota bacterium]